MRAVKTISSNLIQAKEFWESVLLKPERKLTPIRKHPDFNKIVEDILLWLGNIFCTSPGAWKLFDAIKNPNSEIFLFHQNGHLEVPKKVFVKRFIVQLEDRNEIDVEGLAQESNALRAMSEFNGRHKVETPKFYGQNLALCSMVTSFQEGMSFFNVLCQSPVRIAAVKWNVNKLGGSLSNLGRWLAEVHNSEPALLEKQNQMRSILEEDLSGIEMRVNYLEKARPADFPSAISEKIRMTSTELVRKACNTLRKCRLIHGDFAPSNMLYRDGRICVLDHATCGLGLPENDLSRMYLELKNIENYSYMFSRSNRGSLISAFFSGYGREIDSDSNACEAFYLIKYCILNTYVFAKHWGNKGFLNPFLCRLFYSYQRNFLFKLIGLCS